MVFSTNKAHIDENPSATNFQMLAEEYKRMKNFRPSNYNPPAIDWERPMIDDDIVGLVSELDLHITNT